MSGQELDWDLLESRYEDVGLILFEKRIDRVRNPRNGKVFERLVLESSDWVNVVALDEQRGSVMIRQYRFGVGYTTLETPGGMVDPGDDSKTAAVRELLEETGYESDKWTYLGAVEPNPAFHDHLSIPLVGLNTFILIVSSFLVVRALEAIRHDRRTALIYNLLGVLVLGAAFVSGQAIEWSELFHAGITASSLFGTPFFTVTGIHGTHVMIGLAWDTFLIVQALNGAYSARNPLGVEVFGLYWHFVDIVWIVLFSVIYLF